MKQNRRKKAVFIFFLVFFAGSLKFPSWADTFYGKLKTGLVEFDDFKHPVYLYVPSRYKVTRKYPLVISLPDTEESVEAHIKKWTGIARSKSLIVLVPEVHPREEDVPYRSDKWFLKVKSEIVNRYHIASDRIYLVGESGSAHYAAYLGIQYPEEFSAVALINGSWAGPFEKLMTFKSRPRKQVPFYVSLREEDRKLLEETEKLAYRLQERGYPVYLKKLKEPEGISSRDLRERMLSWLEEKGQNWNSVIEESKKSLREKVEIGVEEFLEVA